MTLRAKGLLWLSGTRLWRSFFLVRLRSGPDKRLEASVTIKPWARPLVLLVVLFLGNRRTTA